MSDDKVAPFPTAPERLAKRVMHAKEEYAAALAAEARDQQQAIHAVAEYGAGLLELREAYPANKDFAAWVTHYALDQDEPWSEVRERSSAMKVAEVVFGIGPEDAFKDCPRTRPVDIMKWYRKRHPETVKRQPAKPKPVKKPAQGKLALNEEQQLATAEFTPKGKISIEKAIKLHKQRLEKQFQQKVGEEVRREIDRTNNAARQQLAQLRKENLQLSQIVRQSAVFPPDDYKTILACLHPDNSASQAKRARAFDLFKQKERRLVGQ